MLLIITNINIWTFYLIKIKETEAQDKQEPIEIYEKWEKRNNYCTLVTIIVVVSIQIYHIDQLISMR